MKLCSLAYRSYRNPWLQLCVVSKRRSPSTPLFWPCFSAWALVILLVHMTNILYHIFIFTNSVDSICFCPHTLTFPRLEKQPCYGTAMILVILTMASKCDRVIPGLHYCQIQIYFILPVLLLIPSQTLRTNNTKLFVFFSKNILFVSIFLPPLLPAFCEWIFSFFYQTNSYSSVYYFNYKPL